ncbi:hypothetical protein SEPL_446 [Salmonella phage SE_PL]|nr:hypothetical protein 7t3_0109 [Salmonella phage 7t3]QIG63059.1 hypothetical protein SEPL_446 [Salmonella phage SE_PL]WNV47605.1 hypothetical protein [Klebsiella phage fENko-Kae01]
MNMCLTNGECMRKIVLALALTLFSTTAFSTQYQCSVSRSTGQFTKGIITERGDAVSFTTFDNKETYTSGSLFELQTNNIMLKHKAKDNVAFCTNVMTTATEDNFGNKSFKFKNTGSGESLTFYDCEEFQQPEGEEACDIPLPEPSVCHATEPKKLADKLDGNGDKPPEKKSGKPHKPKNPFNKANKPKPKSKMPTPDNMCPT